MVNLTLLAPVYVNCDTQIDRLREAL